MANLHGNQVSERAQSDKQVEDFDASGVAKDVGEEKTCDRDARSLDVVLRHWFQRQYMITVSKEIGRTSCEVGNIRKNIQHRHDDQRV